MGRVLFSKKVVISAKHVEDLQRGPSVQLPRSHLELRRYFTPHSTQNHQLFTFNIPKFSLLIQITAMAKEHIRHDSREAVRVEDYLNDMIQTGQDLRNLDAILQNLQRQQELQRKQVYYIYIS